VAISAVGGLGHLAVQYAKAMGMHVVAIDIGTEKMRLAQNPGADIVMDAAVEHPAETVQNKMGGAHTVLVTAVSLPKLAPTYLHALKPFRPDTCLQSL